MIVDPDLVISNKKLTLAQGAIKPWTRIAGSGNGFDEGLSDLAAREGFSLDVPVAELPKRRSTSCSTATANSKA